MDSALPQFVASQSPTLVILESQTSQERKVVSVDCCVQYRSF